MTARPWQVWRAPSGRATVLLETHDELSPAVLAARRARPALVVPSDPRSGPVLVVDARGRERGSCARQDHGAHVPTADDLAGLQFLAKHSILRGARGLTARQLGASAKVPPSTVAATIRRLGWAGLVVRDGHRWDLSPAGLAALPEALRVGWAALPQRPRREAA